MKHTTKNITGYGKGGLHVTLSTTEFKKGDEVYVLTPAAMMDLIEEQTSMAIKEYIKKTPNKLTGEDLIEIEKRLYGESTTLKKLADEDVSNIKKAVEEIILPKLSTPVYQKTGAASSMQAASTACDNTGELIKAVKAAVREVMDDYTGLSSTSKHRL